MGQFNVSNPMDYPWEDLTSVHPWVTHGKSLRRRKTVVTSIVLWNTPRKIFTLPRSRDLNIPRDFQRSCDYRDYHGCQQINEIQLLTRSLVILLT